MNNLTLELNFNAKTKDFSDIGKLMGKNFGFEPRYIKKFEDGEMSDEIPFSQELFLEYMQNEPRSIYIMSSMYEDNSSLSWCHFTFDSTYRIFSIKWRNIDFDIFLISVFFHSLIHNTEFICGYLFNTNDVFDQNYDKISYHKSKGNIFKTKKNNFNEDVVDTSENWGRHITGGGINFMAAPKIWVGQLFYKIIPEQKLRPFTNKSTPAEIDLFDYNEYPVSNKSREKQKQFWKEIDLSMSAEEYEKTFQIDKEQSFKTYFDNIKKKGKR